MQSRSGNLNAVTQCCFCNWDTENSKTDEWN